MKQVYNSNAQPLTLGAELGRGGEGAVFEVDGEPARVAKIYHEAVSVEKAAKLSVMVGMTTDELLKLTAWAVDTLHERPGGRAVGVLMHRLNNHKEIHHLYSPKSRLAEFTRADWRFLVHAAANVARAFHIIHESGNVIGDVNHGNIVIASDATVKLIDCDSFQISTRDGRKFPCAVGVSTHTPPELQGKPFANVVRTPDHDAFGLAVVIFQLLFMGRHPFSGTYLGAGEMPLEKAIGEFRFAYGASAGERQMRQPPGTLSLDAVTKEVSELFSRAFTRTHERPTAKEWIDRLNDLASRLKSCTEHPAHYFLDTLSDCPWCGIEGETGATLFPFPFDFGGDNLQGVTLDKLWEQISSVKHPGAPPALLDRTALHLAPSSIAQQTARARRNRTLLCVCALMLVTVIAVNIPFDAGALPAFLIIIAGCITTVLVKGRGGEIYRQLQSAHESARVSWHELDERWRRETNTDLFEIVRRELETRKREYEALPQLRQQKLERLRAESRARQLQKYLDRFEIEDANISGIGSGRKATLQSYGIETAADVDYRRVLAVPGFGPTFTDKLVTWRASLERSFRFDPSKAVDPSDIAAVEREIAAARSKIVAAMRSGLPHLRRLSERIRTARASLKPTIEEAAHALAQAETDWKSVSSVAASNAPIWATAGIGALLVFMIHSAAHNRTLQPHRTSLTANTNTTRLTSSVTLSQNLNVAPVASAAVDDANAEAGKLFSQGVAFTKAGRFQQAADSLRRAVSLKPDYAEAHHELGYALFRLKKFDESAAALQHALRLKPGSAESHHLLGLTHSANRRWNEAVKSLRRAVDLNPNSHTYYFDLGTALKNAGDNPSALKAFQNCVRLRPNHAEARYELGLAHFAAGDREAAEEQCRKLESLNRKLAERLCDTAYQ